MSLTAPPCWVGERPESGPATLFFSSAFLLRFFAQGTADFEAEQLTRDNKPNLKACWPLGLYHLLASRAAGREGSH